MGGAEECRGSQSGAWNRPRQEGTKYGQWKHSPLKKGVIWVTNIQQMKAKLYQAKDPDIDPIVVGKSLRV